MKSEWNDSKKKAAEIKPWMTSLTTKANATGEADAKAKAKTAATKFSEYEKKEDDGTRAKLKTLYETAVAAVTKAESAGSGIYQLQLKTVSSPKFWHNANARGKEPEWTYSFVDTKDADDKGEFKLTMTAAVGKNEENKQSELMNDLAIAEVKKLRKGAKEVKLKG